MQVEQDRIVREPERARITGRSKASWRRDEITHHKNGLRFPKRVEIGPRAVGWKLSELQRWLESRKAVGQGK